MLDMIKTRTNRKETLGDMCQLLANCFTFRIPPSFGSRLRCSVDKANIPRSFFSANVIIHPIWALGRPLLLLGDKPAVPSTGHALDYSGYLVFAHANLSSQS